MMQVCIFISEILTSVEQVLVGFDSLAITTTQNIYNVIIYNPKDLQDNKKISGPVTMRVFLLNIAFISQNLYVFR